MKHKKEFKRFFIPKLLLGKNALKKITPRRYWKNLRIMYYYTQGRKFHLFALLLFSMLLGMMETFQIVLLYPILDASLNLQGQQFGLLEPFYNFIRSHTIFPELVTFCLIYISFVILTFIVGNFYNYISLTFTKSVIIHIKYALFTKLIKNDFRFYIDTGQGDILYSVISAPGSIKTFLETATKMFSDIIMILSILIMLFFLSPLGMVILIIAGSIFLCIVRIIGNRISYVIGKIRMKSVASENKIISEYVHGARQIRAVSAEYFWKEQYDRALFNYWDKYVKYKFTEQLPGTTLSVIFYVSIGSIVIVLYYLYQDQFISIIPLIGTFGYSGLKILPKLSTVSSYNASMMDAWPNLESVYQFLEDRRYLTVKNGNEPFEKLGSDIVFKDVGFSYYRGQDLIHGLDITIRKNAVTALVGLSGSGKSTIISLLLRYYDVTEGQILLNEIDLREYDLKTFLLKIGYVSQDTFIYNASIKENIAFGGMFSDDEIIEAGKKANIHEFITRLSSGYDTLVGDRGIKLSGGEKQRIAIARALVRKPEILVLDEATSSLDNESEAIVQESINRVSQNVTTFVIAHRLSTIRKADLIYVMSKGKIVEQGTHEELIAKKGRYYELYETGN